MPVSPPTLGRLPWTLTAASDREDAPDELPVTFADYLELVDGAGHAVRDDNRGAVAADAPPLLARLGIDPEAYIDRMGRQRQPFIRAIGRAERLRQAAAEWGPRYLKGIEDANGIFSLGAG